MDCTAPTYMTEISRLEFVDLINTLNYLRDGWSNGVMYRDARTYSALAFYDEVNHKFYKAKPKEQPLA